ncbi:hypothetical protein H1R20_g15244, partial [Candolleomyces eurysporus]
MAPESKTPPGSVLSRVFSRFSSRKTKSAAHAPEQLLEGSSAVAGRPSSSFYLSAHSVPDSSLPVDNSAPRSLGSQPPSNHKSVDSSRRADLPWPPQPFLEPSLQPYDSSSAVPRAHGGTTSFLAGANGVRMRDIQYFEASHIIVNAGSGGAGDKSMDGWELLLKNTAPNALYNSSVQFDAPKCDEDTRVEVTSEIMDWIQDHNASRRLLCMTGAAGAGKSALQQTIAERCAKLGILAATFCFSSTDPTRNRASTVVATIAYQLGLKHPLFQSSIVAAVKRDPLIFSQSLQSQMEELIVRPFESLRRTIQPDIDTFPCAVLIDGLDECKGEPNDTADPTLLEVEERRQAEDRQAELLSAIWHCILKNGLPLRVFIASRPEWAIRTALAPGGQLHHVAYHIQLSDNYDATGDMRRYLGRRFEDIGLRIGNPHWFTEDDINALVEAASGQFVYVATVFEYISERRASPAERLRIVLGWTPHIGQVARPFKALDTLYTNILLAAKNAYEAVDTHHGRDFLLLFRAHEINVAGFASGSSLPLRFPADVLSVLLGLEAGAEESLVSDLHSLVALEKENDGDLRLHLYHKSFSDFLGEESRSKDLFVAPSRVYTHRAKCCMQHILECSLDFDSLPHTWEELPLPESHRRWLMGAARTLPFFLAQALGIDDEVFDFTEKGGWHKIDKLLPLSYRMKGWLYYSFQQWRENLRHFAFTLTVKNPEIAKVISEFVEKWECDAKGWGP